MEEKKSNKKSEQLDNILTDNNIAFSDKNILKDSIPKEDFEALLYWTEYHYMKIADLVDSRHENVAEAKKRIIELKEHYSNKEALNSVIREGKRLMYNADYEFVKTFSKLLPTINNIGSFLNTFRPPNDQLKKLDINFVKRVKDYV